MNDADEMRLQAAYDGAVRARRAIQRRIADAQIELNRLHEQEDEAAIAVVRAKQALEWASKAEKCSHE